MVRSALFRFVLAGALVSPLVARAVPLMLPVQGRLLDSADRPVTGAVTMTFALYPVAADLPNTNPTPPLWSASYEVQVFDGVYAVNLGELPKPEFPADLFSGTAERYLGIAVHGGSEMTPRLRLGSVPHAFVASRAFQADDAQKLGGEPPAAYRDASRLTGTVPVAALDNAVLSVQGAGVLAAERTGTSVLLSMQSASPTADGYLAAADFARFESTSQFLASRQGAWDGKLAAVSHDASLAGAGTSADPLRVTLARASSSVDGYFAADDFARFESTSQFLASRQGAWDGKLAAVSHDASLTGAGTSADPLKVTFGTVAGTAVEGNDPRLSSSNYLQNQSSTAQTASFHITGNGQLAGTLTAGALKGNVGAATVPFDFYNPDTHQLETKTVSAAEALCEIRHGIWSGTRCDSPLAYGASTVTRTTTDAAAIATCPTGFTPADCQTAYSLLQTWRLNPNTEAPNGHVWCAGSIDGGLNSDAGKRGAPGHWYAAGSNAPMICNTGSAIVIDQCVPGENGCVGRASYPRPHMYCQPETQATKWLCISTRMP